jgi:hypothetical protein
MDKVISFIDFLTLRYKVFFKARLLELSESFGDGEGCSFGKAW